MKTVLIILAVLMLAALPVSAQIPRLINYQGVLTDDMGVVASDGLYGMTFRLYDVPSGGTALWEETIDVNVSKGIFSTTLGHDVVITEVFDEPLYLALEIDGGGELSPRRIFTANAYALSSRAVYGITNVFPAEGNVGIGYATPEAPLHIYTSIADSNTPTLLIQNTGDQTVVDFMMAMVTEARIRKAGGGDLFLGTLTPQGITFQLNSLYRHRMRPDGSFGINNLTPLEMLDVGGAIRLGSTHDNNAGTIRWTGADFEGYDGSLWQSLTSGSGSSLPVGASSNTLHHNGSDWVAASNLSNDGTNIGIGTSTPGTNLHIAENADAFVGIRIENTNTGATSAEEIVFEDEDGQLAGIRLYDNTNPTVYAGSMAIYNNRPSGSLLWRTGGIDRMKLLESGELELKDGPSYWARHYQNSNGGNIKLYDENGSLTVATLEADASGTGGFLSVARSETQSGFYVDGNALGLEAPTVAITGPSRSAIFSMGVSGNSSVTLPADAIGAAEILDEPGVASDWRSINYALSATPTTIAGRSITVPGPGYVLAIGTTEVHVIHSASSGDAASIGVSSSSTTFPSAQDLQIFLPVTLPTSNYFFPVTVQRIFTVGSAGTYTYYLLGREDMGEVQAGMGNLSLLYVPTSYGTVDAMASGDTPSDSNPSLERTESEDINKSRIESELAAMRERIAALEAELENK